MSVSAPAATRYRNPWHKTSGPEFYETSAKPQRVGRYLIYNRIPGTVADVVIDGVCVTQRVTVANAVDWCRKNAKRKAA